VNDRLEWLLRRDRQLVGGALALVTIMAWAWMLAGAGMSMNGFEMTRHTRMGMDMMPQAQWGPSYAALMFSMWWIMMIAMMLPSAAAMILVAAALNRRANAGRQPFGSTAAFTSGYLLAWAAFSLAAVGLQWALQENGLISGMLRSTSTGLSAALLIAAGAWQFTPWKHACLQHCRGPVEFLIDHKRPGNLGALIMGAHHGVHCLGCCWFLMALLFVGGVMNLYWILGLAIYVWVEKMLPAGIQLSRAMGALLVAWGVTVVAGVF
jgi:predicted metal-binding membrane protein